MLKRNISKLTTSLCSQSGLRRRRFHRRRRRMPRTQTAARQRRHQPRPAHDSSGSAEAWICPLAPRLGSASPRHPLPLAPHVLHSVPIPWSLDHLRSPFHHTDRDGLLTSGVLPPLSWRSMNRSILVQSRFAHTWELARATCFSSILCGWQGALQQHTEHHINIRWWSCRDVHIFSMYSEQIIQLCK
jgi:hypothetical protein